MSGCVCAREPTSSSASRMRRNSPVDGDPHTATCVIPAARRPCACTWWAHNGHAPDRRQGPLGEHSGNSGNSGRVERTTHEDWWHHRKDTTSNTRECGLQEKSDILHIAQKQERIARTRGRGGRERKRPTAVTASTIPEQLAKSACVSRSTQPSTLPRPKGMGLRARPEVQRPSLPPEISASRLLASARVTVLPDDLPVSSSAPRTYPGLPDRLETEDALEERNSISKAYGPRFVSGEETRVGRQEAHAKDGRK